MTVEFSLWLGSWAWEPWLKAGASSAFSTVCENMTHICHRSRVCMHEHASWWDIYADWREIWKNRLKPRNVVIVNNYFLSTHSVQLLLKSGKTVFQEKWKEEKYIWIILRTIELRVTRVRTLNGFPNVMIIHYATKTMTIFSTLFTQTFPRHQRRYISRIKKAYLQSICILLSKLLL